MADFEASFSLQESYLWPKLRASEILEVSGLRHCVVGEALAKVLDIPFVVFDLYLAVADEQLDDAYSILLEHKFIDIGHDDPPYVDENATKDSPSGWPGHRLIKDPTIEPSYVGVLLIPASLWHLDLGPESFSINTFLYPGTCCRLPRTLFYVDALIDALVERFRNPEFNLRITHYFEYQYAWLLTVLPENLKGLLPAEDQFFIDLFHKVLWPSARKKVCLQRQQIRIGLTSVDDAKESIPRKDLGLAALKAKYQKAGIRNENTISML